MVRLNWLVFLSYVKRGESLLLPIFSLPFIIFNSANPVITYIHSIGSVSRIVYLRAFHPRPIILTIAGL